MGLKLNIFLDKKILIYGLGKSGLSAFHFLKNKNDVFLFDDFQLKSKNFGVRKRLLSYKKVLNQKFDRIILSPGIDINKCSLSRFLKKNYNKIYSDLDVFYAFFKNDCITVTGTNGKSTTCKLLHEILLNQKFDARLVGNIGNPILSIRNVKKKTVFVIEASSYQLDYSKNFRSKYAVILNLAPDHIERHKSINKYIKAKFKLLENQSKKNLAFVKKEDVLISDYLKSKRFKSKIIRVNTKNNSFSKKIDNSYFSSETNKENLSFVFQISNILKLKKNLLIQTIQKFKGLKYRQQIVFKNKFVTIINDSKSTSFASSVGTLKTYQNIHWLLGGLNKKGDKLNLSKKYFKNINAYIFGKNKKFFNKTLNKKIKYKNFKNLKDALKKVCSIVKKDKFTYHTILFSPSAASFDSFKNFEDRGYYFNKLIKNYFNGF
ncbi:UDP-N-acetylmuramoyl-L-alanine--D-glutamate ligase [Candidatus Pelagibacter sp.]|nr:UDP-N-acetylmuramoyl-L-alanine--D-glutamate ligase [Candidatus Pelagibacter sp.]